MSIVFHKNGLCDIDSVSIGPSNRAFRYGDGCFEAINVYKGVPVFWGMHYLRLNAALDMFNLKISASEGGLKQIILDVIEANSKIPHGVIRLMIYRKGKGKYFPETNEGELYVEYVPARYELYPYPVLEKRAMVFDRIKLPAHHLGNHKTLNKSIHVQAAIEAQRNGYDEALIMNEDNEVAEAISSNVYLLINDQLHVPPLSAGGLNGSIRKVIVKQAEEWELSLVERPLDAQDAENAQEIWTSNAGTGLSAVTYLNHKSFTAVQANKVQKRLMDYAINSTRDFLEIST